MAHPLHRDLPFQHVTTGDARAAPIVVLQIEELLEAGAQHVALVTAPGTEALFAGLRQRFGGSLTLIEQPKPLGLGDAVLRAESWVGEDAFIVQFGDHLFVTDATASCTAQLIEAASRDRSPVCAVQVTNESQLPYFGVVGGSRVKGSENLYVIDTVLEKPTPTVAEESCKISGLRQGTYLALFGAFALTPQVFDLLRERRAALGPGATLGLTECLAELAVRARVLAVEVAGLRIDLAGPFGLLSAELALSLRGPRRGEALRVILEQVAFARGRER
jgi:UTP--glucose-1-phosphate uridylyltransferase